MSELDEDVKEPCGWSGDARIFEHRLKKAIEFLDPYMDAPLQRLREIYLGVGSARGRRALLQLVERQISLLQTLKTALGRIEAEGGQHAEDVSAR